jgi:hypothetical protein
LGKKQQPAAARKDWQRGRRAGGAESERRWDGWLQVF